MKTIMKTMTVVMALAITMVMVVLIMMVVIVSGMMVMAKRVTVVMMTRTIPGMTVITVMVAVVAMEGKGQTETFGSRAPPLTHSLKVPSPPQAYTRSSSPEAASRRIFSGASIGAFVT